MDKIQKILIKAGRKDLAQEYFNKTSDKPWTFDAKEKDLKSEWFLKLTPREKLVIKELVFITKYPHDNVLEFIEDVQDSLIYFKEQLEILKRK
jgi:hypothetical protein